MSTTAALIASIFMGLVIFLCRAFAFIFLPKDKAGATLSRHWQQFFDFVEKAAPPVAMAVLALNDLSLKIRDPSTLIGVQPPLSALPALLAAVLTAGLHVWKRNALFSIVGGVVLYMVLIRVM
jgi:branched-subunit amino acid transport protein AzlD